MRSDERSPEFAQEEELVQAPTERVEEEVEGEDEEVVLARDNPDRYFVVMDVIERLFAGEEEIGLDEISDELTTEELEALRALQEAVAGRTAGNHRTVYAEERLRNLGSALAGLQPILAEGLQTHSPAALEEFQRMVDHIEELRSRLVSLEDAQEELFEQDKILEEIRGDEADEDEDEDIGEDIDEDEGEPSPSTLVGAPGDAAVEQPEQPSTLAGAPGEATVEQPERPSTLGSDEPGGT